MAAMTLDGKVPAGPLAGKWSRHRFDVTLVNPANKRHYSIIVVGSGLAGASAAASLAELGYGVRCFCIQDSPRRAHSIAAQGGINAAKNYPNDGDSVYRLFYDTIKGGDYRSREANVYRLAEVSNTIIDQCVAQGVPFAREYSGLLANRVVRRRAGVAHLLRARPDRPAAPARRLQRPEPADRPRQRADARAPRDAGAGGDRRRRARYRDPRLGYRPAPLPCRRRGGAGHRRLRQPVLPVHQRQGEQRHRHLARPQARRPVRQPLLRAASPHLHPGVGSTPVQAHPDEREPAQRRARVGCRSSRATGRAPAAIPDAERNYYLEERYPAIRRTWCRATSPRAPPRRCATAATASAPPARRCTWTCAMRSAGWGVPPSSRSTATCSRCTSRLPAKTPTRRRCASILPCTTPWAGWWVDYNLMSTVPGLFVARRGQLLRPRRQPARRQRADAGARGRLLRAAGNHRQLPRRGPRHRPRAPTTPPSAPPSRMPANAPGSCSIFPATSRWTTSTVSSAASCGITAECRATPTGCARRRPGSRSCASGSGARSTCPARAAT